MPLKYWRTMICALALGLIGLVVWADDRIRISAAHKEQRAQTEPQAVAPPPAQIQLPTAEPINQPAAPKAGEPALNEKNFDLTPPIVTTPVAQPVVPPPPPAIEIVIGKSEPPLAQVPEVEIPLKVAGATEIVPAPSSPALPEPPPPIPQAAKPEMKPDVTSVPLVQPANPAAPPPPPPLPSSVQLPPAPPPLPAVSPKHISDDQYPPLPPAAPSVKADLPPLPAATSTQSAPQSLPAVPAAKTVANVAPFRLHLHMGGAQTHRFEIRDGDKILLKVYCDKVELHGAQDGSACLPGLTASGHIHVHGAGLDGTCDQLTVASADGKVTLKGSVHMTCYRGTNSSQVTANEMAFQLNRAGETPVNTKARGTSSVVPASFSNWTDSKLP